MYNCACTIRHAQRRVVLTGGPGAGKTAALEFAAHRFCAHVEVLPESASIVFGGGFPRRPDDNARRAGQRTIFRVQRELERLAEDDGVTAVVLCDRGTLDGMAYWPGRPDRYLEEVGVTLESELSRYDAVIHLRTPSAEAYRVTALRIETAAEAALIDARIADAWSRHPRRFVVDSSDDFLAKLQRVLDLIEAEIPACCRPDKRAD